MEEKQEELATIEALDSGAVYTLALKTHIGMSVQTFRYFAGWCDKIQWTPNGWAPISMGASPAQPYLMASPARKKLGG